MESIEKERVMRWYFLANVSPPIGSLDLSPNPRLFFIMQPVITANYSSLTTLNVEAPSSYDISVTDYRSIRRHVSEGRSHYQKRYEDLQLHSFPVVSLQ